MRWRPSVGWLIAARAVQGAGAALVLTLGLALLSAAFPPERRGAAIGMFSAVTGIAVASGPLVGGAIAEGIDWTWIFWLNVPIGLAAIPFVLSRIEESFGGDTGLDLPGLALISAAAFGIVWGLVRGNSAGWDSLEVVGALAAGVLLVGAFIARELRAPEPMLPMRLFRSRAFSAGNAAIFFTIASLFGAVFFFAQMLQTALGYGPARRRPAADALDRHLHHRRPARRQPGGPLRRASVHGRRTDPAGARDGLDRADRGPGTHLLGVRAPVDRRRHRGLDGDPLGAELGGRLRRRRDVGKAAGANSMMRELGGVFGIAVAVAVFAGAGSYASPEAFLDGFAPAIAVVAACRWPVRSSPSPCPAAGGRPNPPPSVAVPALEAEGGR